MDYIRTWLLDTIYIIPAILIGFTVHEFAHAVVADKLGDRTPRQQGRLTLNPIAHIDLLGFVAILLVHFGWAKPVEINPSAFKHYYKDDLKVSISGVIANFITAIIFGLLTSLFIVKGYRNINSNLFEVIFYMLNYIVNINFMLALFNLLPVPGLDGFHILRDLFPKFFYNIADSLYRYQFLILIALIFPIFGGSTSIATIIIGYPTNYLTNLIITIFM